MMFQTFTTLAALLLLFASNAALAAPQEEFTPRQNFPPRQDTEVVGGSGGNIHLT
jgi:hypothetical protein